MGIANRRSGLPRARTAGNERTSEGCGGGNSGGGSGGGSDIDPSRAVKAACLGGAYAAAFEVPETPRAVPVYLPKLAEDMVRAPERS